jgi:hypothetical protein
LSGKVQPVKLPPKKIKELGYEKATAGKDTYAMVPVSAGETAKVEAGTVKIVEPKGVERIKASVPFHRNRRELKKYLEALKGRYKSLNKTKAENEWFAFKIFGARSWSVYRSIDDLIDDIMGYRGVKELYRAKLKEQVDFYDNLEIIRIPDASVWHREKEEETRLREQRQKARTKAEKREWMKKIKEQVKGETQKKKVRKKK